MKQLIPHEGLQSNYFDTAQGKQPVLLLTTFRLQYVIFYRNFASFEKELLSFALSEIVILGFFHFPV